MTTAVARRPRRQISEARQAEIDARKAENDKRRAEVDAAAENVDQEAPDFQAFVARWGDRYQLANLLRLWVQCPRATALHKLPTWPGMGRRVRAGEKAIWLKHPRTSTDPDKATPENPKGEVFHGASWMPLFDISQTKGVDDFTDDAPTGTDPGLVAEVKRLRTAALAEHPDIAAPNTGPADEAFQVACGKFAAAWKRYEDARDRLKGDTRP